MELLHTFSQKIPMASLFLSVAAGYWIGNFKIGNFSLGGMAGTLLVAVVIGQVGVPVDPVVKDMMFALLKQIYGHRKSLGQFLWILFYHPKKRRLSPLFQNSL
jgi:putative transport protein